MYNKLVEMIATFFWIGRFPLAPGSLTSAAAMALAVLLWGSWRDYALMTIILTILGFMTAGKMERLSGQKDPHCVVIDEVSGMLISCFMLPFSWMTVWIAFFLFRAFDMFKIYPCGHFEKYPGSTGIMTDDIIAGIYTNLTLQAAFGIVHGLVLRQA